MATNLAEEFGWAQSAQAWIAGQGENGDYGREFVLDPRMKERVAGRGFRTALDVGCGEGRFCRVLQQHAIATVGVDIVPELVATARARDPQGDYRVGDAGALDLPDDTFDLVVSYITLVDFPDIARAIAEMARVTRPGGTLLIANLTSYATAGAWCRVGDTPIHFAIDNYGEERGEWQSWDGINIFNWHRPLSMYMRNFLANGLILRHFDEPLPTGGDAGRVERQSRIPWFLIMEWEKPLAK